MATTPSMGVSSTFGLATSGTTISATVGEGNIEILSENLALTQELIRTDGLRGNRIHPKERVRAGRKFIGGDVVMQPAYGELRYLLPRMIAAEAGTGTPDWTYTITETSAVPAAFSFFANRGNVTGKEWVYESCRTARATFRGSPGNPVELTWSIEALTESQQTISTYPALSATAPFVWHDGVFTYGGATYPVVEWETTIDWNLKTDRFVNSQTRTDLPSMDLRVTARFVVPFNTTSDNTAALYNVAGSAVVAGAAADINFTWSPVGAVNLKFDYPGNLKFAANRSPTVGSKDEILMTLESEVYNSAAGSLLIVRLDPTA